MRASQNADEAELEVEVRMRELAGGARQEPSSEGDYGSIILEAKSSERFRSSFRVMSEVESTRFWSLWSNQSLEPTRMLPAGSSETLQRMKLSRRVAHL